MATITAGDFRNGVTFEMDGKIMTVIEFQHVKPGKGAAFVRTKMRNVVTGGVTETSFNPTAKFEQAFVDRKDMVVFIDGAAYGAKTVVAVCEDVGYGKFFHSRRARRLYYADVGYIMGSHGVEVYFQIFRIAANVMRLKYAVSDQIGRASCRERV